jgi:hypothetical protein
VKFRIGEWNRDVRMDHTRPVSFAGVSINGSLHRQRRHIRRLLAQKRLRRLLFGFL